jgi:hypothetical protein
MLEGIIGIKCPLVSVAMSLLALTLLNTDSFISEPKVCVCMCVLVRAYAIRVSHIIWAMWVVQGVLRNLRGSKDVNLNDGAEGDSPSQEKLTGSESQDLESGHTQSQPRKRKTSQNVHSHGSFFLRVGAIGEFAHVISSRPLHSHHHQDYQQNKYCNVI